MIARELVAVGLAGAGALMLVVAAIGVLRFADIFERTHAVRAAAFGAPLLLAGLGVLAWDWRVALKLALLAAALAMTGPALAHLIAHAAHRSGVQPATRGKGSTR